MALPFDVNFAPVRLPNTPDATNPLKRSRVDTVVSGLQNLKRGRAAVPTSSVYFSPTKRQFVIAGQQIDERNEAGILNAFQSATGAPTQSPGGDFQAVDPASFGAYVDRIANPDLGRRFGKNFESATAGMGELAGAGLRFLGAEDVGKSIQDANAQRIAELSPYEMGLEDIDGSRSNGVLDWFAGVVGQFGPSIVETAVAAAVGAGAGAVAGGGANPFTAVGGALAALSGKQAIKQATLAAAKKHLAGETLETAERKLLTEQASLFSAAAEKNPGFLDNVIYGNMPADQFGAQALKSGASEAARAGRTQAIVGGAGAASAANSYGLGVSDIYREGLDSGAPNRGAAMLGGIPYAALDLLPEFLLARRVFGDVGANAASKLSNIATTRGKALELLKRGVKGGTAGAALEGGTEAGQEALLIAANPLVDWNSPEGISRLLNSFAAGAAIGGPIGSLANLKDSHSPVNLLKPTESVGIDRPDAPDTVPGTAVQPLTPPGYGGGGATGQAVAVPGAMSGEPITGVPGPAPYGEFSQGTEQLALPSMEQQLLPDSPDLLEGPQSVAPPVDLMRGQARQPAVYPGQAFLQQERAPAVQPGQAYNRVPMEQMPPMGPDGQYEMFQQRFQQAPVQQPAVEETLGAANPIEQTDLFDPPVAAPKGKAKLVRKKAPAKPVGRTVVKETTKRSLTDGSIVTLELSDGTTHRIQKTTGRGGLKGWFDLDRNERFDDGYLGDTKAEAIRTLLDRENDPEPPKPKGKAALKKPVKVSKPQVKVVAPLKVAPANKAEQEMATYMEYVDQADAGKKTAREAIEFYANATDEDGVSPEVVRAAREYIRDTAVEEKKAQQATNKVTSLGRLTAYLDELIQEPTSLDTLTKRLVAQGKVRALYKEAVAITPGGQAAVRMSAFNGKTVGDYIDAKSGNLNIEANEEDQSFTIASRADEPLGQFKRTADNSTVNGTIPHGRVKMFVKDFASRLNAKPKVHVFKNVSDLKASDPDLFKRAKAARKKGDFETTDAVGYAFGDNVIVFSDYVRTEQQLRFVLAHEAIGHFGLRAILTPSELSRALNSIYNADHRVRTFVDRMSETLGIPREEAIEEWLADYAAEIDSSLISKIWTVIKNALNRLGITFDDDLARLLVGQSRRYVRDGVTGSFSSSRSLLEQMTAMQLSSDEGRFSMEQWGKADLARSWMASSELGYHVLRRVRDIPTFFREKRIRELYEGKQGGLARLSRLALESVQTLDNKATRSEGLSQVFSLFQSQGRAARALLSDFNEATKKYTHDIKTTAKDREMAGKLLSYSALFKAEQVSDTLIDSYDRLIETDEFDANPRVNQDVLDQLEKAGTTTAEQFRQGIQFEDSTGTMQKFQFDVDENSRLWQIYLEQRKVINQFAVELLLSNFEASSYEHKNTLGRIARMARNNFEAADRRTLERVLKMHNTLRMQGAKVKGTKIELDEAAVERADNFLIKVTMAFDNEAVLKQWEGAAGPKDDADHTVPAEFKSDKYKEIAGGLRSIHEKRWSKEDRFKAQASIRNLSILNAQVLDAERYAKRTILGSYVPFKRRGKFQVRVSAYDDKGQIIRLPDELRGVLPYYREETEGEARQLANELEKIFGGNTLTVDDGRGGTVSVTLKPEWGEARQTDDVFDGPNYNEALYILEKAGINPTPQARERLVQLMTDQNAKARQNLQRTANPGWDTDVLRNNAEYLEMIAHVAAKRIYRHRLDDVMERDSLWRGNDQQLKALKMAVDAESDPMRKARARRDYDAYAYKYRYMKDAGSDTNPNTVEIAGKKVRTLGEGERYREEAKALLRWYSEQTNINDSTEDALSGPLGSRLKTAVVFAQLGGTFATAAINTVSLLTHSVPFAAFYNPASASGMGFGVGKSVSNIFRAIGNSVSYKLGDIAHLEKILVDKSFAQYGLTKDEVEFLIEQTRSGPLQAVLPDALLGTARGKITNPKVQAAAQAWMSMFSYTEKLNRRVTALAVYRMEKERALAEGLSERAAKDSAEAAALQAVDKTQGEYSMFNRPRMARGNLLSYVFMYKMFPIITVQMLKRMPLKGKLAMLAMMLLLSGVKGLPFADDLMDLIDTLLQKLGIPIGSVESELYRTINAFIPGAGNQTMRGILDQWTGATFSTRFSTGDLLPLTGALKAGADPWREASNFFGPMMGGLFGFGSSIASLGGMAVDTVGGRSSSTSFLDIMRSSPIALARALGDTLAYADSNAVTNQYGRVVSPGMDPLTLIFRTLGFYPAEATRANDFIRIGKQSRDYMLEVSKGFKDSYIKAAMAHGGKGDTDRMRSVVAEVEAWNDAAEGTGLEIKNFLTSVKKAMKEARRPAGERFLKTTPLGMRDQATELMDIYGAQ